MKLCFADRDMAWFRSNRSNVAPAPAAVGTAAMGSVPVGMTAQLTPAQRKNANRKAAKRLAEQKAQEEAVHDAAGGGVAGGAAAAGEGGAAAAAAEAAPAAFRPMSDEERELHKLNKKLNKKLIQLEAVRKLRAKVEGGAVPNDEQRKKLDGEEELAAQVAALQLASGGGSS
jgi:hypothetical protein